MFDLWLVKIILVLILIILFSLSKTKHYMCLLSPFQQKTLKNYQKFFSQDLSRLLQDIAQNFDNDVIVMTLTSLSWQRGKTWKILSIVLFCCAISYCAMYVQYWGLLHHYNFTLILISKNSEVNVLINWSVLRVSQFYEPPPPLLINFWLISWI